MLETKTFTSHTYYAFNSKPFEKVNNLCEAFCVGYGDESENCVFKSDSMSVWDLDFRPLFKGFKFYYIVIHLKE